MYVLYQESEPQVQFAGQVQLEGALAQVAGDDHTGESYVKTGGVVALLTGGLHSAILRTRSDEMLCKDPNI